MKNSVMIIIDAIPPKSGINDYLSPHNVVIGKTLDCKMHFCLPFGNYAQVHQNEEPRNGTKERTPGVMSLGLIDNAQDGWKFMSLENRCLIKQCLWDAVPMTQEVTNEVSEHGKKKIPQME